MLISYDGQTIEYDEIGNPTKYLEYETLSWTGRNLDFIKDGSTPIGSYTYDCDGLRLTKTVSGVQTEYIYTDGQVSALNIDGDMLYFTHDGNGSLVSVTYDGEIYYYVLNPQGDVIGLCDESGTSVATYTYDEWGYPISAPTSGIGALNPFRYRGYIYDEETGFYLTGTRYYDPEVGRFINADTTDVLAVSPKTLTDKNLFAYCDNNPIMRVDHSGECWEAIAIGFVAGVVGQYVGDVINNVRNGAVGLDIFTPTSSIKDYFASGVGGAIAAIPGLGLAGTMAVGAAGNVASDAIKGNITSMSDFTGVFRQ